MDDIPNTSFDDMTRTRNIQMLKTIIPYMQEAQKKQFAILIKYMELENTIQVFSQEDKVMAMCSAGDKGNNTLSLLNDLRQFFNEKDQESLDMLINMLSMMETYESIFT
ncbi:MAG: hypothetical protein J6C37_08835 [Roseburia sp.]|nr:hypothetical protein [Roseburia sp.]